MAPSSGEHRDFLRSAGLVTAVPRQTFLREYAALGKPHVHVNISPRHSNSPFSANPSAFSADSIKPHPTLARATQDPSDKKAQWPFPSRVSGTDIPFMIRYYVKQESARHSKKPKPLKSPSLLDTCGQERPVAARVRPALLTPNDTPATNEDIKR